MISWKFSKSELINHHYKTKLYSNIITACIYFCLNSIRAGRVEEFLSLQWGAKSTRDWSIPLPWAVACATKGTFSVLPICWRTSRPTCPSSASTPGVEFWSATKTSCWSTGRSTAFDLHPLGNFFAPLIAFGQLNMNVVLVQLCYWYAGFCQDDQQFDEAFESFRKRQHSTSGTALSRLHPEKEIPWFAKWDSFRHRCIMPFQ